MNIYAPPGTKVRYACFLAGFPHDQQLAEQHLTRRAIYTVARADVHDYYTDVYLLEVPGVAFNSVLFTDAAEEQPTMSDQENPTTVPDATGDSTPAVNTDLAPTPTHGVPDAEGNIQPGQTTADNVGDVLGV